MGQKENEIEGLRKREAHWIIFYIQILDDLCFQFSDRVSEWDHMGWK